MNRRQKWLERFQEGMDTASIVPLVEIAGTNRILIENHAGVSGYSSDCICVKVKFGHIQLIGCGLEIAKMTRDQLIIRGRIREVKLCRRDGR